jgi:ankyrin repeat protein
LPIVTQLVEAGADLEIRQLTGETPAMVAANAGWDVVLRYLLSLKVIPG